MRVPRVPPRGTRFAHTKGQFIGASASLRPPPLALSDLTGTGFHTFAQLRSGVMSPYHSCTCGKRAALVLLVLVTWLAIGQGQARSDTMLAFSSGNQQATATFAVSGNNLVVTLSNSFAPSANFKFDEGDVVGGVAFGTK